MKLELCAASVEAIQIAKEFNFDRIELCQSLEQGGLTPSPGMIEYALAYGVEVHVLIRPRAGGFIYTNDEFEIILRDIRESRDIGVHGVVVGILNEKGLIDRKQVSMMRKQAGEMELTFHRAFDDTYEYDASIDALIDCGVNRILSAGLASNVEQGIPMLKDMVTYAAGRIQIMAGGGVNAHNMKRLMDEVLPDAVHFSGTQKVQIDEGSKFSEPVLQVSRDKVIRLLEVAGK